MKTALTLASSISLFLPLNLLATDLPNPANSSVKNFNFPSFNREQTSFNLFHEFGLRYATTSEKQIYSISTAEVYWQYAFKPIANTLLYPSAEIAVAKLLVADMHGVIWSAGLNYRVPILNTGNRLSLEAGSKVNYLSRHKFKRKRYGGPIHFSYKFGINLKLVDNVNLTYTWQHLSNADRYDYNPSLETHQAALGFKF